MPCSTEHVRLQLAALAKSKTSVLARLRLTPQQVQAMCDSWLDDIAKRFDAETVARACDALSRKRHWPELEDILNACRDAQGPAKIEHEGKTYLGDALRGAGLDPLCTRGLSYDNWSGLFDVYRLIGPDTLRHIIGDLKADRTRKVFADRDGYWCGTSRRDAWHITAGSPITERAAA